MGLNLHSIVSPNISAINPKIPVIVQASVGDKVNPDGSRSPQYATPGSFFGSITGNVLTVLTIGGGVLMPAQTLFDEEGLILPGTQIVNQIDGVPGAQGDYTVSRSQTLSGEVIQTVFSLQAEVQPVTWRDVQQMEGLNLGGVRWKAYLSGQVDAVVRPEKKGGDLMTITTGRHAGTWLIAQVLEQWPSWVSAAITLQNTPPPPPSGPPLG